MLVFVFVSKQFVRSGGHSAATVGAGLLPVGAGLYLIYHRPPALREATSGSYGHRRGAGMEGLVFLLIWVGAHFRKQPSLLLQCLALILSILVEFQNLLKDCLQRLLADVKIDAFARLQLLLLLNFAHEFMIAGFYCSDW